MLFSRYHEERPLIIRNPIDKEVIFGDVRFYLATFEELEAQRGEGVINMKCVGTDYEFAHNENLRNLIY